MESYIDKYVICPFYSSEEPSKTRKIHCEGYKKGVRFHIVFGTKELKKTHKMKHCKNDSGYLQCPLYPIIAKQYQEDDD